MRIIDFVGSKKLAIIQNIGVFLLMISLGALFGVNHIYVAIILFVYISTSIAQFIYELAIKKSYYDKVIAILENLDQKYLIYEMIDDASFPEAAILKETLYQAGRAMEENVNHSELVATDFKEYLEMWIHDIKLPISALSLMNYNANTDLEKQKAIINQLNYYVEQVLFMTRADVSEKDYLLTKTNIEQVVNKVLVSQKELLIGQKVKIEKENADVYVSTDSKWLEYIVCQIVSNSVKYFDDKRQAIIRFSVEEKGKSKILHIYDNGIGISEDDLPRVFDKSFTGGNGRKGKNSTGIGLYICKKLCTKMGHKIYIESKQGEYTCVSIEFGSNEYIEL